ncbi:MAG: DUF2007 domain-containing protein [Nitrospirae bacterium]|nr:DUF2007 domain-containing protein [Nitrospirota bacterium]
MAIVKLIEPQDEGELALIKSLLDGNNIQYFVHNEHFGSLYPGLSLPFNRRVVMVEESDFGRAETLLGKLTLEEGADEAG